MGLTKICRPMERIPKGWGLAWANASELTWTIMPIPLNLIVGWTRRFLQACYRELVFNRGLRDELEMERGLRHEAVMSERVRTTQAIARTLGMRLRSNPDGSIDVEVDLDGETDGAVRAGGYGHGYVSGYSAGFQDAAVGVGALGEIQN